MSLKGLLQLLHCAYVAIVLDLLPAVRVPTNAEPHILLFIKSLPSGHPSVDVAGFSNVVRRKEYFVQMLGILVTDIVAFKKKKEGRIPKSYRKA